MASFIEHPTNLTGSILIAMPDMDDSPFATSVIYVCSHSADGAMGLIVNKPAQSLTLDHVLEQLDIETSDPRPLQQVYMGGPVEMGRGFVLHSPDYHAEGTTLTIKDGYSMTGTRDVLEALAINDGPSLSLATLGYTGWSAGQLENEIAQNYWLTTSADEEIIFGSDDDTKWVSALAKLGINPLLLSCEGGRA